MSGFEIYTKKEKFAWKIACMDIGVTVIALSAIFVALFSVFYMPYNISCVYFLQGIAIPLAMFAVWGRKYRILRSIAVSLVGIFSYFLLEVNAFYGVLSCVNSAIRLINKCYSIDLSQITIYGIDAKTSFLWVLCVLEFLFAALLLTVLKYGRGRFWGIFVFLLPVILGIFCGKVPEVFEGCFLVLAIFFFMIASYQREYVPMKALFCAAVLLLGVGLGARTIESSIYEYKEANLKQYKEIKGKLIDARGMDISNWIPESLKKINIEGNSNLPINVGMGWNKHLKTLGSVNQNGQVVDEVVLDTKPTTTVYWSMYEGYVYTGNGWEEKGTKGVYDELKELERYCRKMKNYDKAQISEKLDSYFASGFQYTKNPGTMPADKDFAEGFMFERKEGFCVHFATAATLVYQMCDKEARYVEGYMILPGDFKEQPDASYKAIVTNDMAHAWCETYEGIVGWKVREHTISSGLRTDAPTPTPTEDEEESTIPTTTPTPTGSVIATPTPIPDVTETPTKEVPSEENEQSGTPSVGDASKLQEILRIIWDAVKSVFVYFVGFGMVIAVVWIAIVCQQKIRMKRKRRRFGDKRVKRAILAIYRAVQEVCAFEGLKDRELWRREHIGQIAERFPQISMQEWEWMYDCVERTMFSNDLMRAEEQKQMYGLYHKLRKGILASLKGRRKLWFLYGKVF